MRILIDGAEQPIVQTPSTTLTDILAEVDDRLAKEKRVVRSIRVDGKNLSPEELQARLDPTDPQDVALIEIESAELRALVLESLGEVEDVLGELPVACHTLSALLSGEEREAALSQFSNLHEIWTELHRRQEEILRTLGMTLSSVGFEEGSLDQRHGIVRELLESAATAADRADASALADLLSHDLAPHAEAEERVMARLREIAEAAD